jgi:trehalose 6-phosphate synthase/trehalose 6-phosphate phosphatase
MLTHFFDLPSRTSKRVLLLDYDGTLAPLTADRNRAVPYPAIPGLLDWIRSVTRTRLVIVTERRAFQVATLLGLKHIEIWGCHGLSRWRSDGTYELPKLDEEALSRISDANELLRQQGLDDLLEFKPGGTAVHWRGLEAHANHIARSVERVWSRLHSRKGLQLLKFDGGMEIRVAARDKADVVRTILCETGPGAAIAYLGDDHTDEDAFAALHRHGLTVLVHREYRPTAADVWIRPPEQLVSFLADWIAACGAASSLQRNTAA